MTLGALLYGGLMAWWAEWWGGLCYSARLIVPIVPFLFAPLPLLFDTRIWKARLLVRAVAVALMMISIVFGAMGAFWCDSVWGGHPFQLFR